MSTRDGSSASPGQPQRPATGLRLPWWARLADLYVVIVLLLAVRLILFGPFIAEVLGFRIVFKALEDNLLRAAAVVFVRHLLVRRPSLPVHLHAVATVALAWLRRRWPAATATCPAVVATRLGVLVVGLAAVVTFGYPEGAPPFRFSYDELRNLPVRWDAGWYLGISFDGYNWTARPTGQQNVVFFPAYPMIVRAAGLFRITEQTADVGAWIAVGVSCAAFLLAMIYLYRIARGFADDDVARAAVLLVATYPFAIFFSVPYSESLFLLGCVGACYHASRGEAAPTAAWALLVGLTRPNGLLLSVPLALFVVEDVWRVRRAEHDAHIGRILSSVRALPRLAAAAMPAVGLAIFSAVNWYYTSRPLLWMQVQSIGWERAVGDSGRFSQQLERVASMGLVRLSHYSPIDVLTFPAAALAVVSIWPVLRRLGPAYGAFVALNALIPLAYGLMSMGRFTSVLFPTFIWLALALPASLRAPTAAVFALGQGLLAALFFTWRPVF